MFLWTKTLLLLRLLLVVTKTKTGRTIEEKNVDYTAIPGHVGGFGAIVNGVGRGMPRAISCGKEYTIVATYPYQGKLKLRGLVLVTSVMDTLNFVFSMYT